MDRADSNALVLRYENTIGDIEAWVDCYYRQSKTVRRGIRRTQVSFILLGFFILLAFPELWLATVLLLVPMVLLMPRWFFATGRRNARQLCTEGNATLGVGRQELTATPEGIEVRFETSRHFYAWSLVEKVVHGPRHTFIYIGSVNAIVIPHRATDPVKRDQLVSRIVRTLPRQQPHLALPDGDV